MLPRGCRMSLDDQAVQLAATHFGNALDALRGRIQVATLGLAVQNVAHCIPERLPLPAAQGQPPRQLWEPLNVQPHAGSDLLPVHPQRLWKGCDAGFIAPLPDAAFSKPHRPVDEAFRHTARHARQRVHEGPVDPSADPRRRLGSWPSCHSRG